MPEHLGGMGATYREYMLVAAELGRHCGATTLSGSDLRNYATYMRYGMRSSLKGNYTGHNLGFRCAKETI